MVKDQLSSLTWLAFALLIFAETFRSLSLGSWREPGPGMFPALSGCALGILAFIHFLQVCRRKSQENSESWVFPERVKSLLLAIISLFAYVFLLEPLGFLTATFFLLIILFQISEARSWVVVIGGSILVSFISYLIFNKFLQCQLPMGIWGF